MKKLLSLVLSAALSLSMLSTLPPIVCYADAPTPPTGITAPGTPDPAPDPTDPSDPEKPTTPTPPPKPGEEHGCDDTTDGILDCF